MQNMNKKEKLKTSNPIQKESQSLIRPNDSVTTLLSKLTEIVSDRDLTKLQDGKVLLRKSETLYEEIQSTSIYYFEQAESVLTHNLQYEKEEMSDKKDILIYFGAALFSLCFIVWFFLPLELIKMDVTKIIPLLVAIIIGIYFLCFFIPYSKKRKMLALELVILKLAKAQISKDLEENLN